MGLTMRLGTWTCRMMLLTATALCVAACATQSPVRRYFADSNYSYPLQLNLPAVGVPRLVCPGCDVPDRPAPEYARLIRSGLSFVRTDLSVEYLQHLAGAESEAFLVSDAYLWEDPPGSEVGLLLELSAFQKPETAPGPIYLPHETHGTVAGDVLELKNLLILKRAGRGWEYRGWVY